MKHITDVFFDLDHTLWDFDKNSGLTFETIFKKHAVDLPLDEFLRVYEPINAKYWKLFRENKILKEDLRFSRLNEAFEVLKFSADSNLVEALSEAYIKHLPDHNFLFPDAELTLAYLSNKYKLHIITNGFQEVQHKKLRNSKINTFFKTITTSEDAGVKKPDKIIFEFALNSAQVSKNNSIMIGDNLEADVQGAKSFGMEAIFFGKDENYQGWQVQNLKDLKTIL
ncbi:YjjG family noncanonical pyrimidine nucleotidase [Psychroflexus aestuariivivens]|uniref:YjjG family noncanonical pyrimidine nucleotidase n=1 Tax=Psychroflexus aestuariivivens TaxID=1795040 RepID=UPI000FD99BA6|nr:YjjG family noncanonical pyrimidine nucleotidase [Psychroflexus aestuariivivens]